MAFTLQSIRDCVLTKLGASDVVVELLTGDIDTAITEALSKFDARIPGVRHAPLSIVVPTRRYVISHRNLIDVVDLVIFPESSFLGGWTIGGEPLPIVQGTTLSEIPVGELTQLSMRFRELKKILSENIIWEGHWDFNQTTGQQEYALYIDLPEQSISEYKCSYIYAWNHDADDNLEVGLPTIVNPQYQHWIEDCSLAICKEILGRIRDKFKGLPSSDGFDMQMDGTDLLLEAQQEQETLEQLLLDMQPQIAPLGG